MFALFVCLEPHPELWRRLQESREPQRRIRRDPTLAQHDLIQSVQRDLELTRGLVFSGQLMLALTQKGISREDAYVYTQRNAMKVWDEGGEYRELIRRDADVTSHLSAEEVDRVFDLKHYLRNVEKVFARVFD